MRAPSSAQTAPGPDPGAPAGVPVASAHLDLWNTLTTTSAAASILPCNGSRAWASALAVARPLPQPADLLDTSDRIWSTLPRDAWTEAFLSHPRIGERKPQSASTTPTSLAWSTEEQRRALVSPAAVHAELAAGNQAYEARFGHIFLICAAGLPAEHILADLHRRLGNTPAAEWLEAGEQQRRITRLRLLRWLAEPRPTQEPR